MGLPACIVLLLGAVAMATCREVPPQSGRVLLIGIDGASMRIIEPMLEAGRLPNLRRVAETGVSGLLRSFPPLLSPRIWSTIATGKSPDKHGIVAWTKHGEDGSMRLYYSHERLVHALWNIASDAGLDVGVVNWLNTYPPEKIRGIMVSDHAIPAEAELKRELASRYLGTDGRKRFARSTSVVYPEAFASKLVDLEAGQEASTAIEDPFRGNAALPTWVDAEALSSFSAADRKVVAAALRVEAEAAPDVLMVLLQGIDRASHWLWGFVEPEQLRLGPLRASLEEVEAGAETLHRYYQYTDTLIGLLMDRFGPEDLILVVSDHGFETHVTRDGLTGRHHSARAQDGVVFARGPGVRAGAPVGPMTIRDVTPTILTWLQLPVAEDMDGRPASFLEVPAKPRVASYDTSPIERLEAVPSEVEERRLQQLRSLGYID